MFSMIIKRNVSFLSKEVITAHHTRKVAAIIYKIQGDQRKATTQSLREYGEDISRSMGYKVGDTATIPMLMIHCRPSSAKIVPATTAKTKSAHIMGGHILAVAAVSKNEELTILRGISKGYDLRAYKGVKPEKATIILAGEKTVIKEDYKITAFFHSLPTIEKFLTGTTKDLQAEEYGSRQFVIAIPLIEGMGLTVGDIMENIERYKKDPKHGKIYDRMNDACVHAALASIGMKTTLSTRGINTQDTAVMMAGNLLKIYGQEVFIDFIEQARKIGLAYPPEEIYANKEKIELKLSPS